MRGVRLPLLLVVALAVSSIVARAQTVDAAIVLAADVSRSVDEEEFKLQRRGYAAAVTSPQLLQAIREGPHGAVALCLIEWAGGEQQVVVAKWAVVRDRDSAAAFAETLLKAPRSFRGRTAIGSAINFAVEQLERGGPAAVRRVIDISGDGTSNTGWPVTDARDEAMAKGITINGLAIINEKTGVKGGFFYAHTHPPGGLPKYYRDNVIGGPGAFVLQVVNFNTFAEAMTDKLVIEVSEQSVGRR